MREVVDLLIETPEIVTPALLPYFRDVLDHVIRMAELSDNVRDLLTSARELQLAQVANRQNVVMKQLTAWAAIILIPTPSMRPRSLSTGQRGKESLPPITPPPRWLCASMTSKRGCSNSLTGTVSIGLGAYS